MIESSSHSQRVLMAIAQKKRVRVTLDIECYDDLDLDDIIWSEILDLQGDETVDVTMKEYEFDY